MKKIILIFSFLIPIVIFNNQAHAQVVDPENVTQEETLEGKVVEITKEEEIEEFGTKRWYQEIEIEISKGSLEGKNIVVISGEFATANSTKYKIDDKLVIISSKDLDGNNYYYITDYVRRGSLIVLFLIFAVLATAVGKFWGLASILGMIYSFIVIFKFILPQIINGHNPVLMAIIGSMFIIPVTFYLSHGFNKKTHVAIVGTIISLIITGVLAAVFVNISKLTGYASEEAGFLQSEIGGTINMKGVLLAGIIIGTLGVLDDITVSQSAIVYQLKKANKKLGFRQLFSRAMKVGHDHISSLINTLVLVYAGVAMPLLLLFVNNPRPFSEVINYEIIADEIVRTLVGSIGLITAVPITTVLAALWISEDRKSRIKNN
jgi:uncharacterized membrane protein